MAVQRRRGVVLAAAMSGIFTAAVEATIVAAALPSIVAELGGFHLLSWVFAAYLLAQTATIPVFGRLADLYGRRPIFFLGMGIFLLGSLLCGFADGMISLIVFRLLQGVGAGAVGPVTQTIIGDIYGPEERPKIQGYLSAVWGLSSLSGPLLGGFIVQHAHWSLVFWINVPAGLLAVAMMAIFFTETPHRKQRKIDYLGSLLLMLGVSTLIIAITQSTILSTMSVAAMVAASVALLAILVLHERRTAEPILPLALWRRPIIRVGNGAALMMGAILMSVSAFMPTYVQGVMGYSSAIAGMVLSSMSVNWTVGSFLAGRIMLRSTYRVTAIIAGSLLSSGSVFLILLQPDSNVLWAASGCFLIGLGLGFTNTTFMVSVQSSVDWHERGIATASNLFARLMGQSVGAALFGSILNYGVYRMLPGSSTAVEQLMDPHLRADLDAAVAQPIVDALAHALHMIYLLTGFFAVAVLVLAFFVPSRLSPRSQNRNRPIVSANEAVREPERSSGGGKSPDRKDSMLD